MLTGYDFSIEVDAGLRSTWGGGDKVDVAVGAGLYTYWRGLYAIRRSVAVHLGWVDG